MRRSASSTRTTRSCPARIAQAFLPPYFQPPQPDGAERDIDPLMNTGTIYLHHRHPAVF